LHVKPDLGFVCCLSSIKQLPEFHFYALIHSDDLLPTAQLQYRVRLQPAIATPILDKSMTESKMFETHVAVPDRTQPDVSMSPAPNQSDPNEQPLVPEELFSHGFCDVPLPDGNTSVHCLVRFFCISNG
jgi:hypothetical protein